MKIDDEIVYKIVVRSCSDTRAVSMRLHDIGIPFSKQIIDDDSITINRLLTVYRGEAEEETWQESINKIHPADIAYKAWTPLGEVGELRDKG